MKRFLSLLTALLLCAALVIPALGATYPAGIDEALPRVDDGASLLMSVPREALDARARELSLQYRFDLVIVTRRGLGGKTPMDYADDCFNDGGYGWRDEESDNIRSGYGMLLLIDMQGRDIWISTKGDEGRAIFPDSRVNRIYEAIRPQMSSGDYSGAFTRFLDEAEARLEDYRGRDNTTAERTTIEGLYPAGIDESLSRVVDDALLLKPDEAEALEAALRSLIAKYRMDAVVVTREGLEGQSAMDYADDFFDYKGYGWREEPSGDITTGSGVLLLVEMEQEQTWVSGKGYGMDVFPDGVCVQLCDAIEPELTDGQYYAAFLTWLDGIEGLLAPYGGVYGSHSGENDNDYYNYDDYDYRPSVYFSTPVFVLFLVVGLITALAVVSSMKKKLNTIRQAAAAHSYQQRFDLTERQDIFLYSTTTSIKLPDDPPPSSGSSSGGHISSSGSSHSGGGGSFGGGHTSSSGSSHGGGGGKF